jgi:DeoR family fructose operon transcriptional repressor
VTENECIIKISQGGMNLLVEQRFEEILKIVDEQRSVTVQELMELLDASESTIRRDLTTLHSNGRLIKVHGGAVALGSNYNTKDDYVESRQSLNSDEKRVIAKYAASLIRANDFVYLDAGTTTEYLIDYLEEKNAVFVTNAIAHARKLIKAGCTVYLIGGELKASTEAIVGNEAIMNLNKYNFTKGFFGTNGVSMKIGFTTPDLNEAMVKKAAFVRCSDSYVLCDSSKFNQICPITFAEFSETKIITTNLDDTRYKQCKNILEVNGNDLYSNI